MLEYEEVQPLPARCIGCEEDCGSCDYALDRWKLTPESEKHLKELWEERRKARRIKLNQLREELRQERLKNQGEYDH